MISISREPHRPSTASNMFLSSPSGWAASQVEQGSAGSGGVGPTADSLETAATALGGRGGQLGILAFSTEAEIRVNDTSRIALGLRTAVIQP